MIGTLFSMHNIKYIISVDDCFLAKKREEMEAIVYSQMCSSLDPFKKIVFSCNRDEDIDQISELMGMGADPVSVIQPFLVSLDTTELLKCYEICESNGVIYTEEREGILSFLNGLKGSGIISDFRCIPSVSEASIFDSRAAGMIDGAILWLLDRSFLRVGESPDAGLVLAESIVQQTDSTDNYVFILSAVDEDSLKSEDDIEAEFDRLLAEKCSTETHSFIYYINKQRILTNKTDRIAKSLAQGFKRKACFELFQIFTDCLADGLADATTKIQSVRQRTLNVLFSNRVKDKGESLTEFAARFVQIFHNDAYNKAVAQKNSEIASKAKYYDKLCSAVSDNQGNNKEWTEILKEYREIELYNMHINAQHSEITTGDIFSIDGSFYVLVSQSCDTCLRKDGERKLKDATLLEISDDGIARKYSYPLTCFSTMKKPAVVFHSLKILPFEILDLCTFNASGLAAIIIKDINDYEEELRPFSNNYRLRFDKVLKRLTEIYANSTTLHFYLDNPSSVTKEDALSAHDALKEVDVYLKRYETIDNYISFPVKRICRLNELTTIEILNEYGIMLSRIGQPFDFVND